MSDLRSLTDADLREEWLAYKEDLAEAHQVDGLPSVHLVKRLDALKAEMERRGLPLS